MDSHSAPQVLLPSQILAQESTLQPNYFGRSPSPSSRHGSRVPRRSSPLAGPSYSADEVGNITEHSSALEQEIARSRSRLASPYHPQNAHPLPTPPLSRQASPDDPSPRRARPSFISLASRQDKSLLMPPSPSPTLRSRHSSPHIVSIPALSRSSSDLPYLDPSLARPPTPPASEESATTSTLEPPRRSRFTERIRRKSLPSRPARQTNDGEHKPLKAARSLSRLFRSRPHDAPPVPTTPTSVSLESRASPTLPSVSITPAVDPCTPSAPKHAESAVELDKSRDRGRARQLWGRVLGRVRGTTNPGS